MIVWWCDSVFSEIYVICKQVHGKYFCQYSCMSSRQGKWETFLVLENSCNEMAALICQCFSFATAASIKCLLHFDSRYD